MTNAVFFSVFCIENEKSEFIMVSQNLLKSSNLKNNFNKFELETYILLTFYLFNDKYTKIYKNDKYIKFNYQCY